MPDPRAEARTLAEKRLRSHLGEIPELVRRNQIPAARMALDDAMHDLDDISELISEESADAT